MSLAALRASARRTALPKSTSTVARARLTPRGPVARRFNSTQSTPPPAKRSNIGLFAVLGLGAAGAGYYFYSQSDAVKSAETAVKSGVQAAKVAANFVPTQADYVKVRPALRNTRQIM